jgi:hypothetical protein
MTAAVGVAAIVGLVAQQRPKASPYAPVAAAQTTTSGDPFDVDEPAADSAAESLRGRVREVIEVAQYTYLRLGTAQGEVWAAVSKAPVKVDSDVSVENATRMEHFESATLKRTFDVIYFGNLPSGPTGAFAQGELPPGHPSIDGTSPSPAMQHGGPSPAADVPAVEVPRATGKGAHTIGELFANRTQLEGQKLRVRGQVIKVTPGVLGKTYLRLRHGNSARSEERELVVTSLADVQVGMVATFEGTLLTDVDVGIGFRYPVLLSDAQVRDGEPVPAKIPNPPP